MTYTNSYSGFADSFDHESTGLHESLLSDAIKRVFVVGLAEDVSRYGALSDTLLTLVVLCI